MLHGMSKLGVKLDECKGLAREAALAVWTCLAISCTEMAWYLVIRLLIYVVSKSFTEFT